MILAILQARMSSSRLPGKVLKPVLGAPMLARQIERLRRSACVDQMILATSNEASDDPIERLCRKLELDCFRGNLNDVLDRFYRAARSHNPDHVVRLTGDCPLTDPELIDEVIRFHLAGGYDYTSNCFEPTFPHGLDVEVFRFSCLEEAWREASLPYQREHVTPFFYQQTGRFRVGSFKGDVDLSWLRWTVDESADFELVTEIYSALYPGTPDFTTRDILAYLENHPELTNLNTHIERDRGYQKLLREGAQTVSSTPTGRDTKEGT